MQKDGVPEESDYASSYDTEASMSDRDLDVVAPDPGEKLLDSLKAIVSSIGAMDAVHAAFMEKLASLESAISTVQFDMKAQRDNMRGIQGAMENMSEDLCEMRGAHMEVERLREQISLNKVMGSTYKPTTMPDLQGGAPAKGGTQGMLHVIHDDEVGVNVATDGAECSIRETQLHNMDADTTIHNLSSPEEGGGNDWNNDTEATTTTLGSPPCAQTRTSDNVDLVDDETQHYEFSGRNVERRTTAEQRTPVSSRSMWAEFTNAVRDLPAPEGTGVDRVQGWISTKRARESTMEITDLRETIDRHAGGNEPGSLNLNLPPDKQATTLRNRAGRTDASTQDNCGTSRGGGRGGRRGRGRGRRPPPVQPRYHTPVSPKP